MFDTIRTVALYATVPMIVMEFVRVFVPDGVTRDGRVLWNMPSVVLITGVETVLVVIFADAALVAVRESAPWWMAGLFALVAAFWGSRGVSELLRARPTPEIE